MSGWDHYADQQGSQRVKQQLHDQLRAVEAERDEAQAENQRLREALRFYAYNPQYAGDIAREALAGDAE